VLKSPPFGHAILVAMTIMFASFAPNPARAEVWPIKAFDVGVEVGGFDDSLAQFLVDRGLELVGIDGQYEELRSEIETTLARSAEILEAAGFPPPDLEPVVPLLDGSSAYRVYLVRSILNEKAAGIYHPNPCTSLLMQRKILLDVDKVSANTFKSLTVSSQSTVAHELFHAVQAGTNFFQGCHEDRVGSWITEGTARAVGYAIAEHLDKGGMSAVMLGFSNDEGHTTRSAFWGLRDYSKRLPIPAIDQPIPPSDAYATSSFWRYLGEVDGKTKISGKLKPNFETLNYLATFLSSPPVNRDCEGESAPCKSEIEWLDAQTRAVFGKTLRDIYARFVQSYAQYSNDRFEKKMPPNFWDDRWLKGAFGDCASVTLNPELVQQVAWVTDLESVSARCLRVVPQNYSQDAIAVAVALEMPSGKQVPSLERLTVALADGTYRMERAITENAPFDMQLATMELDFSVVNAPDDGTLLLLSNVADAAEYTTRYHWQDDTQIRITFTPLVEYASLGRAQSESPGLSTADLKSLAAAIDAPLEIDLVKYRAMLMRERHKKVGDSFIGTGEASGVERPCLLQISGEAERREGLPFREGLLLELRTSGPVVPDQNYPIQSSKDVRELSDFQSNVAFVSTLIEEANGELYDFDIEQGELVFDVVTNNYIAGRLSGEGVYREYSLQTQQYEVRKVQKVVAKFGMRVKAAMGRLTNKPYACLSCR